MTGVDKLEIVRVGYDHPDAAVLVAAVQQEYVRRYGGVDITPVDPSEFTAPDGTFLVGYVDDQPVASGGWRRHREGASAVPTAEIKRMYVVPAWQRNGFARAMLAELERTAAAAGYRRLVLETGLRQPEAVALYTGCGYIEIDNYGVYRHEPDSRCYGRDLGEPRDLSEPEV